MSVPGFIKYHYHKILSVPGDFECVPSFTILHSSILRMFKPLLRRSTHMFPQDVSLNDENQRINGLTAEGIRERIESVC